MTGTREELKMAKEMVEYELENLITDFMEGVYSIRNVKDLILLGDVMEECIGARNKYFEMVEQEED